MTQYVRPSMKVVKVTANARIAEGNCWSQHKPKENESAKTWYYDHNGSTKPGYIMFQIDDNCGNKFVDIEVMAYGNDSAGAEAAMAAFNTMTNNQVEGDSQFKHQFTDIPGITPTPDLSV